MPQVLKNKFQLNGYSSHVDSFSSLNGVSKAQLDHTKELIGNFESLISSVKKHQTELEMYVNHCYSMFEQLENILEDRKNSITLVVDVLKKNVLAKSSQFENRTKIMFDNLKTNMKALQKKIKEREYLDLDYIKFSSQKQKYVQNVKTGHDDIKKSYENEQKLTEVKHKIDMIDIILARELPTLLIFFNKITEFLTVLICCYVHDLYETMYESFWSTKRIFPPFELDNISFQQLSHLIKERQRNICKKIDILELFNSTSNIYTTKDTNEPLDVPTSYTTSKFGTALYPFISENEKDLTFNQGDIVRVVDENPDGWWIGVHLSTGKKGFFPNNYFKF